MKHPYFTPVRPEGFIQGLVDRGFAQTSRVCGHVSRVRPEHVGNGAWYHARVSPAETETLTPEELREFKARGGPTAGPGWDGRPPKKIDFAEIELRMLAASRPVPSRAPARLVPTTPVPAPAPVPRPVPPSTELPYPHPPRPEPIRCRA